jgi:D-3-phosphoglycerate dehydrogenase
MTCVITDNRFGEVEIERTILESKGVELRVASCASSSEVVAACKDAEGILVNLAPLDAAAIEALPRCRVISRYGVGLDNIDLAAAGRMGIIVRNVPGYCDRDVAEHALGLILAIARGIPERDRAIRRGAWNSVSPGRRVAGTTLGILGFGGTARALARSALSLGFSRILVWSPHIDATRIDASLGLLAKAAGVAVVPTSFEELLEASDWVSVNLPLTPETRAIIDAAALARMKRGSAIVNVARGPIVDEEALIEALESGNLGGAGLDVYAAEPLPPGSRLRSTPHLVLTDHSAYASVESISELRTRCAENALEVISSYRGRPRK